MGVRGSRLKRKAKRSIVRARKPTTPSQNLTCVGGCHFGGVFPVGFLSVYDIHRFVAHIVQHHEQNLLGGPPHLVIVVY